MNAKSMKESYDGQLLDITAPEHVEVILKADRSVLWVNVEGICRLRICGLKEENFQFNDEQFPGE